MKILWLNAGLLLPLDKGGKLRTWHLMRHLAARHDITYLSFADPAQTAGDRDGMREVCAHLRDDSPHRPGQGHLAVLRRRGAARGRSVSRTPSAKYRSAAYRARVGAAARAAGASTWSSATSCRRSSTCRERLPCPVHPLHAQRRGGDLAAARGERAPVPSRARCSASSGAACCGSSARRSRASIWCSRSPRPTARRFARALSRRAPRRPVHVVQTGVDTDVLRARQVRRRRSAAAHLVFTGSMDWLPNEDGMLYFVPRDPAAHPRRPSRTSR